MAGERRAFGFWGMVGTVMVALKLKEHYDDHYASLPGEEEGLGHGPVALRTPNMDEDALDGASLLDTQLPSSRPKRQRKDCCVCCGMRCGLFWKAFGIVCLVFAGWQAIRLIFWAASPTPTGLEGMPEFSTSLGCTDAPHLYEGGKQEFTVAVGQNQGRGDHSMDFRGGSVGTVTVVEGEEGLTEIKYELTLRTNDESLLDGVLLDVPTKDDIDTARKSSRVQLSTPRLEKDGAKCMRYDVKVFLPQAVKTMHVQSHTPTQVKFDTDSNLELNSLSVSMYKRDKRNMVLLSRNVHAAKTRVRISEGWLVGEMTLVEDTSLMTQDGDAVMNVHVFPAASSASTPVKLATTTGAGRADVFYARHGDGHRAIDASHVVAMGGQLYLTYKDAAFNGTVDLNAKSFSATGLQNAFKQDGGSPYVGSKEGADRMLVKSNAWVGLYF